MSAPPSSAIVDFAVFDFAVFDFAIFDFDGTLADTYPWFASVLNDVADRYRFRRVTAEESEALRSLPAREIIRHLGIPAWKLPLISRHMRGLAARGPARLPLFPGVPEMLAELERRGIGLAIVSSNAEATIRAALGPESSARIGHYACGAGLFGKGRRLRAILRAARIDGARALYVGDELRDHAAADEAGCRFGAVAWGYTRIEALAAANPAVIFADPREIPTAFAGIL